MRRLTPFHLMVLALFAAPLAAQQDTSAYVGTEVMIPMRDGVKLHTIFYVPKNAAGNLPIILTRTPYGIDHRLAGNLRGYYAALARDGYIFAYQDIRGRYGSEGTFVMQRPPLHLTDKKAVDESTDAYDTIDWLVKQVPGNSGRVGMLGISYPGWTTAMALIDPHPALRAASPQASPADMWMGDDFHHQGAFRLSYGFEYAVLTEASDTNSDFSFDRYDTYDWYRELGPLSHVNDSILHGSLPTWNDFVAHPNYDAFWQRQAIAPYLTKVTVPTLNVAGWWDQEDFYGPIHIYEAMEPADTKHLSRLVVGPWNHGGWAGGPGQKLGSIDFGSPTGEYFRDSVQAPFFAYHLKDQGEMTLPEALTWESGANRWVRNDAWPATSGVRQKQLYFRAGGKLSFDAPLTSPDSVDSYLSDPADPVPYRRRPIEPTYYPGGSGWSTWLLQDQRLASSRPDVLVWETDPLTEDVVVRGNIAAHLFASTTGQDADWVVKLIDVYPEQYAPDPKLGGYQLMVANDVLRGRYRESWEHPTPIPSDSVVAFTVDMHTQDYRFLKGHRIMVQVQSSWFPIIDRNPQTWVPNIFKATAGDFQAQTHRVYRSPRYPSHVSLDVGE
ncbi:MAG TPA: CocE/NonD family hydrolase [Gemmatimonadales bacterium]|nr:CocE/NonD family hydrolase [Gemmatimonadales bacterium]